MQFDMVFEGGGAKGMAFAGALEEFESRGHSTGRLLGTSAGAIVAMLLAAGYNAKGLLATLNEREGGQSVFSTFLAVPAGFTREEVDGSVLKGLLRGLDLPLVGSATEEWLADQLLLSLGKLPLWRHVFSFMERGGWYSSEPLVKWLRRKLNEGGVGKLGNSTLSEFAAATGRNLTFVASDTTNARLLILNAQTAPELPVVQAVRMSMSIPMVWEADVWRKEWGGYRGRPLAGAEIVDGGILSNFPMELFLSNLPLVRSIMGPQIGEEVLGILIDETMPVPDAPPGEAKRGAGLVQRLLGRQRRLVDTVVKGRDKQVMESNAHLVAHLPAQDYGATEFDMDDDRRKALVEGGRNAMRVYLDGRSPLALAFGTDVENPNDRAALRLVRA
jgi:predicted acylesterase/phospholipase RssA